jgi:hypothetical protein
MANYNTILNTTFVIHSSIEAEFIAWLRSSYIPAATQAGVFGAPSIARVLTRIEPDTESIAVQLPATSLAEAQQWHDSVADELRNKAHARWSNSMMFFSTYMELIDGI